MWYNRYQCFLWNQQLQILYRNKVYSTSKVEVSRSSAPFVLTVTSVFELFHNNSTWWPNSFTASILRLFTDIILY